MDSRSIKVKAVNMPTGQFLLGGITLPVIIAVIVIVLVAIFFFFLFFLK
jgi:hypothetical protein